MRTRLRGCRIVDVDDGKSYRGELLINEGRICSVGPEVTNSGGGVQTIDCDGLYVLPGFIDTHVHLVWDGSSDPVESLVHQSIQEVVCSAVGRLSHYLPAGITTIRDLGSSYDAAIAISRAVREGEILGPTVVASGRALVMTGGHDPFWGLFVDGIDAAVRGARELISLGADTLKVAATGGVYGRREREEVGVSQLSETELRAIAEEAHRFGLRVVAHAIGTEGIENALRAGVDDIQHGIYATDEQLNFMAMHGIAFSPTLLPYLRISRNESDAVPSYAVAKARGVVGQHQAVVRKAFQRGIKISAGSDAGSPDIPHPSLYDEVWELHEAVLPAHEAVRSMTVYAAEAIGLGKSIGRLRAGYRADLVLVRGDPFLNFSVLQHPEIVFKGGRVVHVTSDHRTRLTESMLASSTPLW